MKKHLIQNAQNTITDLRKKRHTAMNRMLAKRRELLSQVGDDTPDLFGSLKSEQAGQLFTARTDPKQIPVILEPYKAEVALIDREIDKWETDLFRLAQMSDNDLFTDGQK